MTITFPSDLRISQVTYRDAQNLSWKTRVNSDVLKGRVKLLCEAGLKAEYLCSSDLIKEEPDLLVDKDNQLYFYQMTAN